MRAPVAPELDVASQVKQRLFIGIFPAGIVYADRWQQVAGDYKRLAFLPFRSLELEWSRDVPEFLVGAIKTDAAAIQAKRGQAFQISTAGQTVILGQ